MATRNFITIGGQLIGEIRPDGVRVDYGVDALGSVTSTIVGGLIENTYAYSPLGSVINQTGSGEAPSFGWNGESGYLPTGRKFAELYVRARHYSNTSGRFTSRDPVWPGEPPYQHASGNPVTNRDPSGMSAASTPSCDPYDPCTGLSHGIPRGPSFDCCNSIKPLGCCQYKCHAVDCFTYGIYTGYGVSRDPGSYLWGWCDKAHGTCRPYRRVP